MTLAVNYFQRKTQQISKNFCPAIGLITEDSSALDELYTA